MSTAEISDLPPYPIDLLQLLASPPGLLAESGQPSHAPADEARASQPEEMAQSALAHWNAYLANGENEQKEAFMGKARRLLAHEVRLPDEAGGWLCAADSPACRSDQPWLSASVQGCCVSVLLRAHQLSQEEAFLSAAQRAVRTFELDVLDGGVQVALGDEGVFFAEVPAYPPAHILKGHILGLLGLYDYVACAQDERIEGLIRRGLATLHTLLASFDTGYWTRCNLLDKRLASRADHALHVALLAALAGRSGCEHCARQAARWAGYQRRPGCQLRLLLAGRVSAYYSNSLRPALRRLILKAAPTDEAAPLQVCVPITQFPVPGGMRGVLAGVAQVMDHQWRMVYLTNHKGQATDGLEIETFGHRLTHPWQFPGVWLYWLAGLWKLLALFRRSSHYQLILPQDGVFTGAFAALAGKLAGVRVVCMDHGNVTWLANPSLRRERMKSLEAYAWPWRVLSRVRFSCYWLSLEILARMATRCSDQFLVAGDEVEEVYRKRLGVSAERIIRYAYMVDAARFPVLDNISRRNERLKQGLSEDTILITMINRLAPEKGLDFALEGIARALSALSPDLQSRVRVLIAGDGPLRSQVEAEIRRRDLHAVCILWGEAQPQDVVLLLGISDIFLYSGTRGTNYSVAVLEAMAAGCAVIASASPASNARLLADERGIAIAPGQAVEIGNALLRLCNDPALCRRMGQAARAYVAKYHTASVLKRKLLQASFFNPSDVVALPNSDSDKQAASETQQTHHW